MTRPDRTLLGRMLSALGAALLSTAATAQTLPAPGATVEAIKKRGELVCGVDSGIPGFAYQDSSGTWKGFDIAYCQALAAAVLGDAKKVKYVGTTAKVRFTVLQSGEIDVLIRDSTLTFSRDIGLGLSEVAVNFYAGQGFMVRKSLGVKTAAELQGATICMITGATLELNIADFARSKGTTINSLLFDKTEEAFAAAEAGRCDGYSDDTGSLAAAKSTMKVPDDWIIMPEVISKEPLGLHTRDGDYRWSDIVFWVDTALKTAEEFGVTKENLDSKKTSTDPFVRRLLGLEGDFGKQLGLDNDAFARAIKAVGNYAQIYDEHFGPKTLGLPRGQNNLYTQGGLHYPLPFR
ncbi:amino acid ABC transporter substrate-binding protein [Bosea sp. PAMC 26642]|uniref:amino acid ABC transporter substrate-binding protein n=1 Tax=Bosea sp. (strain PAMC 26642) TaxID=1792307 RepID=UPI000AB645F4|nr:amino acid ABC transporter substrate-binding protein [Bosea sp. PAMC 26642]